MIKMRHTHTHIHASICFDHVKDIIENAHKKMQNSAHKPLVVFDIDDVLITAKDQVLRGPRKDYWLDTYFFNDTRSEEESVEISGYTWATYQTEVCDPKVVSLQQHLKKQGIPNIALTAGWNGPLGPSPSHCDDRIRTLKNVGIEFHDVFPHIPPTSFTHLENCGRHPSFKQGILFACMIKKPLVLDAFCNIASLKPAHIIFVDDMMYNLTDMQDYCAHHGIAYDGVHYTGVEHHDNNTFDEAIAHLQFQTALRHKIWLSDDEARARLNMTKERMLS